MVGRVRKSRGGLVAYAVDTEMLHGAYHAAAAVVAGTVEPLCAVLAIHVDEIQAPGLLGFCGGVGEAHGHAAHAGQVDRLAVFLVADFQVVGRAGANSGKRVPGQAGRSGRRKGHVPAGLAGYLG